MNNVFNTSYRYQFTNRLGSFAAQPLSSDEFSIQWTRNADAKLDYSKTLPNTVVIKDEKLNATSVYKKLLRLEESIYRCDFNEIVVERLCGTNWVPWFSGRFSLNAATWDLLNCVIEIKIDDGNADECFENVKGNEIDLLQETNIRRSIGVNYPGITVETVEYHAEGDANSLACNTNTYWGGPVSPFALGYGYYYWQTIRKTTGTPTCEVTTKWARETMQVPCNGPQPSSEWIVVNDFCSSANYRIYARPARTYGCELTQPDTTANVRITTYSCKLVGDNVANPLIFDNGIPLEVALQKFAEQCPGMTIVSNFYQINPDVVSDVNYVTGLRSQTRFVTLYQKSDVKRPAVANNASKALLSWEDLMTACVEFHNTRYRIEDNNVFRIEHVSYFTKNYGFDLVQRKLDSPKHFRIGGNPYKYSYDSTKIFAREEFKTMEASEGDFRGLPIIYSGGCVITGKDNVATHAVDFVTTDVQLCLNNPEPESKVVDDDGFVFIAADINPMDGSFYVLTEAPILSTGSNLNNVMSWAHLHRDYHKYDRSLSSGVMNDQPTQFLSTKPSKKGDPISFPLCCGDTFNPDDLITTPLGVAIVGEGTFSFKENRVTFTPLYNADLGLTTNRAPVAGGDVVSVPQDVSTLIDPIVNDNDPDTGDFFTSIQITMPPLNGTAIPQGLQILYTPNPGFTGFDPFRYRVLDQWQEPSNSALIALTVVGTNSAPVAVDDSYDAILNTPLSIAAPGLFANDTDNIGFTLDSYTQPANGSVVVNTDGSFTYTPNNGFIGIDTFTYIIIDGSNLTDTATVTIETRDPNAPIANDDTYNTRRGINANIPAPGLLGNDTTPIGTLSAVAGTFTTTQGGSAVIATDGSFDYSAPAGFIGTDTFTYTATNGTASDTATVTINVFDYVFVKLERSLIAIFDIPGICNGQTVSIGEAKQATFTARFYRNAGGTVPFNVTNLALNYSIIAIDQNGNQSITPFTVTANGNNIVILTDYEYYREQYDCNGNLIVYKNESIAIAAGNYTII